MPAQSPEGVPSADSQRPLSRPPVPQAAPEKSREDTDVAWGDYRGEDDDTARLLADRPPHWADF